MPTRHSAAPAPAAPLEIRSVTPERWPDLKALFGPRGACAGCWCMWWRLTRAEFGQRAGAPNREALHAIVASGAVPGLLAFANGRPVGWCAVEPCDRYPALDRSRVLARVDDMPVWSVTCSYVARSSRRRGVTERPLGHAPAVVAHARAHGARIMEGYPVDPRGGAVASTSAFTGLAPAFLRARFVEVARRSPTRPIVRYYVEHGAG